MLLQIEKSQSMWIDIESRTSTNRIPAHKATHPNGIRLQDVAILNGYPICRFEFLFRGLLVYVGRDLCMNLR